MLQPAANPPNLAAAEPAAALASSLPADDRGAPAADDAASLLRAAPAPEAPASVDSTPSEPRADAAPAGDSTTGATGVDELAADEAPAEADRSATVRLGLLRQLDQALRLPTGLRQRLAQLVDRAEAQPDGREAPLLTLGEAVRLFEEALPPHLMVAPGEGALLAHPAGESFFRDPAGDLSDADARSLAAAQLARSGFARR